MKACNQRSRDQSHHRAGKRTDGQQDQRIGHACDAGIANGVGADTEQSCLPERRDTAVAGDKIERENQERDADKTCQKRKIVGKSEIAERADQRDGQQTERFLPELKAGTRHLVSDGLIGHPCARPKRPRGNRNTVRITAR